MAEPPNVPGVPVTPVSTAVTPEPRGYAATEPVKIATQATQLVTIIAAGGALFGLDLDENQRNSLLILAPALVVLLQFLGSWLRSNVTPVERAQNKIDLAFVTTPEPGGANKPTLPTN